MILGFISVISFIEINTGAMWLLSASLGETFDRHMFEFVHFAYFTCLCFYVIFMVTIMYISVRMASSWVSVQTRGHPAIETEYARLTEIRSNMTKLQWIFRPHLWYRVWSLEDDHMFFVARAKFIDQHALSHALEDTFNYAAYLTKCIRHMLTDLVSVHVLSCMKFLSDLIRYRSRSRSGRRFWWRWLSALR
jgi:hypothetical protein